MYMAQTLVLLGVVSFCIVQVSVGRVSPMDSFSSLSLYKSVSLFVINLFSTFSKQHSLLLLFRCILRGHKYMWDDNYSSMIRPIN